MNGISMADGGAIQRATSIILATATVKRSIMKVNGLLRARLLQRVRSYHDYGYDMEHFLIIHVAVGRTIVSAILFVRINGLKCENYCVSDLSDCKLEALRKTNPWR